MRGTMNGMPSTLHSRLAQVLHARRSGDGGFPTSLDGDSEVEPTIVAALGRPGDEGARRWLQARQRADGTFEELDGRPVGPTTGALAALVLPPERSARALAQAKARRGLPLPNAKDSEKRYAWGWTDDTRSLVEPTARVLLAVNALTPDDAATRREAIAFMQERHCADGGWNFGNASVYDVDLRSYPQTTAIALLALQGATRRLVEPGLRYLRDAWQLEPGGLTIAQSLLAFRFHGRTREATQLRDALDRLASRPSFVVRPLAVAWAVLATGPDALVAPLRSRA